jgi:hypothetical protein
MTGVLAAIHSKWCARKMMRTARRIKPGCVQIPAFMVESSAMCMELLKHFQHELVELFARSPAGRCAQARARQAIQPLLAKRVKAAAP